MSPMDSVHVKIPSKQIRNDLRLVRVYVKAQESGVAIEMHFNLGMVHVIHMRPALFYLFCCKTIGLAAFFKIRATGMERARRYPVIPVARIQYKVRVGVGPMQVPKESRTIQHESHVHKSDVGKRPGLAKPVQRLTTHGDIRNHPMSDVAAIAIHPMQRLDPAVLKQLVKGRRGTTVQSDQDDFWIALRGMQHFNSHGRHQAQQDLRWLVAFVTSLGIWRVYTIA